VHFFLLSDPSLPSYEWLLTGLHLLAHPLHHALHPNRGLPAVYIIFHLLRPFGMLGFVELGFATMVGRNKSLLRQLMLRRPVPWLDTMGLDKEFDPMELDSMESGKDPDAMESDAGPEVLCHNLLV